MRPNLKAVYAVTALPIFLSACAGVSPSTVLTDEDRRILSAARAAALETNKTGQSTNWSNSQSGNRGSIVPTRTYKSGSGADCREFQQTTTAAGETDLAYGASCREAAGGWKIVAKPSRYRPGEYRHDHFGYGYGHAGRYGYPYFRYGHRYSVW